MKMNNQHSVQKDKISFGAPFGDWIKETAAVTLIAGCKKMRDADIPLYNISPFGMAGEAIVNYAEAYCPAEELRKGERILNATIDAVSIPVKSLGEAEEAVKNMKGKGFKGVVKGVSKVVGAPISAITTTCHEVSKDLKGRPSSPREKKARIVVDTYTAGTAATGAAVGAIPLIGSSVDSFKVSPDQRKLMVQEIADIYGLSREEKYDLFESLNLDDYNRFEGPVTDVISIVGKETAEQVAKEATSEVIKEGATQIASNIPGIRSVIRAGVNSVSAKTLGEKAIKECKRLAKRH